MAKKGQLKQNGVHLKDHEYNTVKLFLNMGYDIELFDIQFTPLMSVIYVIVVTAAFFGIAVLLNRKK